MGERCTLVQPIVRGIVIVKFDDEPEARRLRLVAYEQCADTHTIRMTDGEFIYHRCRSHMFDRRLYRLINPNQALANE